jgi:curli biogenesis system outer membrane secretion channel CsgG
MKPSLAARAIVSGCISAAVLLAPMLSFAAETAQEERSRKEGEIPKCPKKYGTIAVVEPEHNWWQEYGLGSPAALIKVYVNQSGCFTLLDRGKGMAAAKAERELASSGELRGGSGIGKGQVKAADYVLVPDLISQNRNAGGNRIGGILGGLLPGAAGAVLGGISLKKKTADVVLTVTDVRSSEQLALSEGHSTKTDLGWGAGGGMFGGGVFAAGGATGYADTEIGDDGQARSYVCNLRAQRSGRARPRSRHDALSDRAEAGHDVGGRGRTRQQGLGVVGAVPAVQVTAAALAAGCRLHLPMQKPAKIRPSSSSLVKRPVISPSSSCASRNSSATSSRPAPDSSCDKAEPIAARVLPSASRWRRRALKVPPSRGA